ncbi:MAG: homocysteine S-methyltransferase [Ilumatobacter sp.]|nr:homocysteine S-methyltransferase [Ilumatobacter sp.]
MNHHRTALPQLDAAAFLADGGIETSLIFDDGIDLPDFASFHLLSTTAGRRALERYFERYAELAVRFSTGIVLETPTWRSSPDWGARLGYSFEDLMRINGEAVRLVDGVRRRFETPSAPIVVSGCVGPRGDGYDPGQLMTAEEARAYHAPQIRAMTEAGADMISAITMTNLEEGVGVIRAARAVDMPVAVAFTVETDGVLPTGQPLAEAITAADEATEAYAAYYMVNCAHPTHFSHVLDERASWTHRIRGVRANASRMSHAELDEATELDPGDPDELASQYAELRRRLPGVTVLGGCCGTNEVHVEAIAKACVATATA